MVVATTSPYSHTHKQCLPCEKLKLTSFVPKFYTSWFSVGFCQGIRRSLVECTNIQMLVHNCTVLSLSVSLSHGALCLQTQKTKLCWQCILYDNLLSPPPSPSPSPSPLPFAHSWWRGGRDRGERTWTASLPPPHTMATVQLGHATAHMWLHSC